MGWVALGLIGAAAFAALRLAGLPPVLGWFAGAALMLGATGYALQQQAGLPGRPVRAGAAAVDVDPGLSALRSVILPGAAPALTAADARLGSGDSTAAARGLLDAIARDPRDPALWTGLGSAIVAHDEGQMSPAAGLAFRRATKLAPHAPGPPFFLGLAYVQAGDLAAARTAWLRALALSPPGAPYRLDIAERLMLLDQFQAMADAQRRP